MKVEFSIKLVVASIIVAYCVINAIASLIISYQRWQAGPVIRTTGKVLSIDPDCEFSFIVNGKEIKGWRNSPIPMTKYTVGQQIDVYYKKDNPEIATPYWFVVPRYLSIICFAISIVLFITAALIYYLYNRNLVWVCIGIGVIEWALLYFATANSVERIV